MPNNTTNIVYRSHLKKRILVKVQGGHELQPASIQKYSEELKQGTNTGIGPKNYFEVASTQLVHLHTLKSWFPDQKTAYDWCGPGLRYPFTHETFMEDIHWEGMPAYSLLNENKELIGFGQYYKKAGRCHLARLVVSPSYRSMGIGYKFINRLMEIGMEELKVCECSLFVIRSNTNALKCYRALQFEKAEYPPGHEQFNDIDFMVRKSDPPKIIEKFDY